MWADARCRFRISDPKVFLNTLGIRKKFTTNKAIEFLKSDILRELDRYRQAVDNAKMNGWNDISLVMREFERNLKEYYEHKLSCKWKILGIDVLELTFFNYREEVSGPPG